MNRRAGITDDGRRVWAYSPGHVWSARRLAEAEAERRGLRLAEAQARIELVDCAPGNRPPGRYEVYVFEIAL